ncbi:chromosomal replication initiator protein DnaA [Chitinispirillales bacterium ANBcel5]|uniref:chromosomal replication initiator protein DnaA n=1 Tax=Cellulosispirillum alkaliphilum TaxID=3039283 RepID=UPI002A556C61|nr:chromosomal replication initiator protein DnaA [Chitinispirillales bacterium ANBcel5]
MHTQLWNSILSQVSRSIDAHRFETWFRPLSLLESDDPEVISVAAPNQFIADFLDQHYKPILVTTAKQLNFRLKDIVFTVGEGSNTPADVEPEIKEEPKKVAEPKSSTKTTSYSYPQLNKRYSLETFVVGPNNEFARSAALAVAEAPGKTKFNPLLIYGGVGLGKTHLLQSIGNYLVSNSPNTTVTYISSEEFYLNFIDAIKNNSTKTFTSKFRSSDVLLMDDIQFFAGKESTQEEFFYIFNTLYQNGKQIVLTSDLPPSSLRGLQDRLISRFQWGLAVDIQPPDLETRVAILKKRAEEDNLDITQDILYFIAEHVSSNIRELEGVVIRLLAFASITRSDITLELVKTVLKDSLKKEKRRVTINDIIEAVGNYYKVPVNNIREKNRRKEVAFSRQVAMYISKSITNNSLKTIGLNFGGRDHSTVIHAVSQIENLIKTDETVSRDVSYIINTLNE